MTDWLRFVRLGLINILGVTVPGILLLLFIGAGFLFPLSLCVIPVSQLAGSDQSLKWQELANFWTANKLVIFLLGLVLAYITGYIIRLTTPDDLDRISGDKVISKMGLQRMVKDGKIKDETAKVANGVAEEEGKKAAEMDHWPYRGEPDNKFPYFHFKDYLEWRGLRDCANLVEWLPPANSGQSKRSKTHMVMMKLDVLTKAPELSAILESTEAHIRLMSGTWVAIKTAHKFVIAGVALSIGGVLAIGAASFLRISHPSPPYAVSFLVASAVWLSMDWAKRKIEDLFHYQRVRELVHIVAAVHYAHEIAARAEQKEIKAAAAQKAPPLPSRT